MVSEFLVYAAIVGVILVATLVGEATHSETGKNVLNLAGFVGVAVWSLAELAKLKPTLQFVRHATCGLGEWVKGRNDQGEEISGFVLDVAVDPGVQLIGEPRGHPAKDISDPDRSVPLNSRRTIKPLSLSHPLCPERQCEFWIPNCEIGLRKRESDTRTGMRNPA